MLYNFSKQDRCLFPRYCMNCGRTDRPIELHHIKGRWNDLHSSPLNGIILCKTCHDAAVQNDETAKRFFKKTMFMLKISHYILTEKDINFLIYYNKIYGINIQTEINKTTESLSKLAISDIYIRCFGGPVIH